MMEYHIFSFTFLNGKMKESDDRSLLGHHYFAGNPFTGYTDRNRLFNIVYYKLMEILTVYHLHNFDM